MPSLSPARRLLILLMPSRTNVHNSLENEYLIQFHDDPDLSHEHFLAHTAIIHATAQRYSKNTNYIGPRFRAFHGHLDPEHVEQLRQLDFVSHLDICDFQRAVKRIEPNALVITQHGAIPGPLSPPSAKVELNTEPSKAKRDSPPTQANLQEPAPRSPSFNIKVHAHDTENWGQSRLSHRLPNSERTIRTSHSEFLTSTSPTSNATTTNSKVHYGPNFTAPPPPLPPFPLQLHRRQWPRHAHSRHSSRQHLCHRAPDAPRPSRRSQGVQRDGVRHLGCGTSMAASHVAGLAAYFMMVYGAHRPEEMRQRLIDVAIKEVVKDKGEGSTDAVAYNGVGDPEEDADS
ncbi:hypothetical protein QBC36DRAFT_388938 [Triangularia setosa]|uniref:Peptidase S8/S53 domain-containing protein n=1 Tax=Triangularia setosa TaxID=2587417 RepID=A0AAN6W551_9PEZI|nr:hypothetical protein QBC36DRAFT_388938 [Podospora setosa]